MQPQTRPIRDAPVHRTLTAHPLRGGGWRIIDSAGLVGGLFRDRRAALKAVVRERWATGAVVALVTEPTD